MNEVRKKIWGTPNTKEGVKKFIGRCLSGFKGDEKGMQTVGRKWKFVRQFMKFYALRNGQILCYSKLLVRLVEVISTP